tara:strand:+ start:122 stop:244 length:123 start_codon:yes stop_codon:yes gene_type:complete
MDFLVEYLPTVHIGKIVGKREDYSIDYTVFLACSEVLMEI